MKAMYRRAFTLIELLVVISIIALLASIVLASLNAARDKGRIGGAKYFAAQVDHAEGDQAVGMWDFDDCPTAAAADRSGNNYTATLTNGATSSPDTPTGIGCSVTLDGSNDFVLTPLNLLSDASNPVTLSAWFKTSNATGIDAVIGHNGGGRIDMWRDGNSVRCRGFDASENSVLGATRVNDGKWHQAVCIFDSAGEKLYIDGKSEGSFGTPTNAGSAAMYIGKSGSITPNPSFNGLIDGVHIFTKSLTASQVEALYAASAPSHRVADAVQ